MISEKQIIHFPIYVKRMSTEISRKENLSDISI